jgi:hypothetical protein
VLRGSDPELANFSDDKIDAVIRGWGNVQAMDPGTVVGGPIERFFQGAMGSMNLPAIGQNLMELGMGPQHGQTAGEWAQGLPVVSDIQRIQQGDIAGELGSLAPSLLVGGMTRVPGAIRAINPEALSLAGKVARTGIHLLPYGGEVLRGYDFLQAARKAMNPPVEPVPTRVVPPPPVTGSSTARFNPPVEQRPVVSPPPVTYQAKPQPQPIVPPPPVTYQAQPTPGPVVPPPPVTYKPTPISEPTVPPPPVTYQPRPGAPPYKPAPNIFPPTSSTERFNPPGVEEPPTPTPRGKKVPTTPEEEIGFEGPADKYDLNRAIHAKIQRLNLPEIPGTTIKASPAGARSPGYASWLAQQEFGKPYDSLDPTELRQMWHLLDTKGY